MSQNKNPRTLREYSMRAMLRMWRRRAPTEENIKYIKVLYDRGLVTRAFIKALMSKACRSAEEHEGIPVTCSLGIKVMACMAHCELLENLDDIGLGCGGQNERCGDISGVKTDHLRALIMQCSDRVVLNKLSGDLENVFRALRCKSLRMANIYITKELSLILHRKMMMKIEELMLHDCDFEDFEIIRGLTSYDGKGSCAAISHNMNDSNILAAMEKWCGRVGWSCVRLRMRSPDDPEQFINVYIYQRIHEM